MSPLSSPELMLKRIAQIRRMERGKLCLMRQGPSGPYYSHQTWQKGRNLVRYVPRERVLLLQTAIAGYQNYLKLTQAYADLIIARTRQEQSNHRTHRPGRRKRAKRRPPGRGKILPNQKITQNLP